MTSTNSRVLVGVVAAGVTLAAIAWLRSSSPDPSNPTVATRPAAPHLPAELPNARPADGRVVADLERRIETLASQLAAERAARQQLEERLDALAAQMPPPSAAGVIEPEHVAASPADTAGAGAETAPGNEAHDAADDGTTPMERALVAAGVEPAVAADVKRRQDEVALAEIYLRDQATREGWLDSPRFGEELAHVQQQRTSIRDEIGDDSYDRYLAALGEPNRVRVAEVLMDSPAAAVGLQTGDVVLRYGDTRIFAPDDLVSETRSGTAGEPVRVEILRGGQRVEIEVPRGPLGLRIAASQANPDEG